MSIIGREMLVRIILALSLIGAPKQCTQIRDNQTSLTSAMVWGFFCVVNMKDLFIGIEESNINFFLDNS